MHPNELFLQRYAEQLERERDRIVAGHDPSMFRIGDELVHIDRGERTRAFLHGSTYDRSKHACHAVVATALVCESYTGRVLDHRQRIWVERQKAEFEACIDEPDTSQDERKLYAAAITALCSLLERDVVPPETLVDLAAASEAPMAEAIDRGTRDELTRLHEAVMHFTRDYDEARWERLHVVICANHQARYKHATKQYFQRLLSESHGLGARGERQVLYAENAASEDEAVRLLATHLVDARIGRIFEQSPLGLKQDVLGRAAQRVVVTLLDLDE